MNNKKNIDRLFQEKFKDFEVAPNDAMWDRISQGLPNKKEKRRVIPIWWQIGGVAAVIAILLTVGVSVFNSGNINNDLPIVDTKQNSTQKENINSSSNDKQDKLKTLENQELQVTEANNNVGSSIKEEENSVKNTSNKQSPSNQLTVPNKTQLKSSNAVVNAVKEKVGKTEDEQKRNVLTALPNKENNTKVAANTKKTSSNSKKTENKDGSSINKSDIKSAIKKTLENNSTEVAENTTSKNLESSNTDGTDTKNSDIEDTKNTIVEDPEKQSIEDAIVENTIEKEDKQNRWSIAPNVAPVYFGSLGEGSPINDQFVMNSKSGDINMSYGIAGSYAVSKRLKVRAGINRVNLNHVTTNVVAFTGTEALMRGESTHMSNVKYKNHNYTVSFMDAKKYKSISKAEIINTKIAGEIDQRFGFIEVPLELEYRLLDKKLGINVIGGFSTFFLSNNEIYADIDGISTLIGEANNINSTSFSANFGLGLDYSLSKQWNINLEPQFKYQLNTFNNTSGNFRPFFIGVYTGLSFKF
ncbi:hypothetical protein [Winogradskyella sp.]|uniref:hypothetical protein n=1 Tax=Winogradskyella sp. TaxID=1883156 RepID=UPI003F6C0EC4